jgi:hypothetical protein
VREEDLLINLILGYFTNELYFLTVIAQIYEWLTMITIILWQKDKSLGKMIYIITEEGGCKYFMRQEGFNLIGFITFVVSSFLYRYVLFTREVDERFTSSEQFKDVTFSIYDMHNWIVVLVLSSVFAPSVYLIKNYHLAEYLQVKTSMWVFYVL